MSKASNHVTRVTVTVETASGDTFTVVEEPTRFQGDNPRFIGKQFEAGLREAVTRMNDVILANYGDPQQ